MGSLAASAFIGNMHPNYGRRICLTHVALLWEGDRSARVLSDLARPARKTWRPYTYERNVPELLALLAVAVIGAVPNNERMLKRDVTMVASDSEALGRLAASTFDFKGMAMSVTIIHESAGLGPPKCQKIRTSKSRRIYAILVKDLEPMKQQVGGAPVIGDLSVTLGSSTSDHRKPQVPRLQNRPSD